MRFCRANHCYTTLQQSVFEGRMPSATATHNSDGWRLKVGSGSKAINYGEANGPRPRPAAAPH